jgi:hypothetical protein
LLAGRYPPACCSSRLPVFLLRLLQKVNGAQCQQLSLAVLLAWLEPSYHGNASSTCVCVYRAPERELPQEAPAAWAQARPRTSGSRSALYHVHANTAGLRAARLGIFVCARAAAGIGDKSSRSGSVRGPRHQHRTHNRGTGACLRRRPPGRADGTPLPGREALVPGAWRIPSEDAGSVNGRGQSL